MCGCDANNVQAARCVFSSPPGMQCVQMRIFACQRPLELDNASWASGCVGGGSWPRVPSTRSDASHSTEVCLTLLLEHHVCQSPVPGKEVVDRLTSCLHTTVPGKFCTLIDGSLFVRYWCACRMTKGLVPFRWLISKPAEVRGHMYVPSHLSGLVQSGIRFTEPPQAHPPRTFPTTSNSKKNWGGVCAAWVASFWLCLP